MKFLILTICVICLALTNRNLEEQLLSFWRHYYENATSEMTELKQLCSFQEGYVNPPQTKPEYFDGTIKWLRAVDINESYIISTSRTITNLGFASAGKSALLFPPDSIAISKSGTIGRLGIIADKMCGNRAVINIVPYQKQLLGFIYSYLKIHQNDFLNLAVGSVQKNLYVSSLEVLKIKTPYEDFWRNFNQIAHLFLTKIKNNCIEIQKLSNLRDTLLPKLMSGEIDVSAVEV